MKTYLSKKKINFVKELIFDFDILAAYSEESDNTNSTLEFSLVNKTNSNRISISNNISGYITTESDSYTLKEADKDFTYFNDPIIFVNAVPYKKFSEDNIYKINNFYIKSGETYIKTEEYSKVENSKKVKRLNAKNQEGLYVKPVALIASENDIIRATTYYVNAENRFDFNYSHSYRFIVSDSAKEISIWEKIDNKFKKIKTVSFEQSLDSGTIEISVSENVSLTNLRFSFFEANIK